jgi:hypothetical protein
MSLMHDPGRWQGGRTPQPALPPKTRWKRQEPGIWHGFRGIYFEFILSRRWSMETHLWTWDLVVWSSSGSWHDLGAFQSIQAAKKVAAAYGGRP